MNAYSGDELVYSSTLGDWRTHNGVDYACAQDAQVCAPAAGKVTAVDTDSRWGSVVCIEDSAGAPVAGVRHCRPHGADRR